MLKFAGNEFRMTRNTGSPDPIAARIAAARRARRWSFADLASEAGLKARSYVRDIERGEKIPSEDVAARLAIALGEDVESFVAWARLRAGKSSLDEALQSARIAERAVRNIQRDELARTTRPLQRSGSEGASNTVPQRLDHFRDLGPLRFEDAPKLAALRRISDEVGAVKGAALSASSAGALGADRPTLSRVHEHDLAIGSLARIMRQNPFFSEMFAATSNAPGELVRRLASQPDRSSIGRDDLVEIVATKNAQGAGVARLRKSAAENSEAEVRRATALAFAKTQSQPLEAIDALRKLHGVEVATASAILSWCKPDIWPVIDQRALSALVSFGILPRRRVGPPQRDEWVPYVKIVSDLSHRLGWPPQRIDRWLYAFDKCQLTAEDIAATIADSPEVSQSSETSREGIRAKASLLVDMSHELRTPLNAVIGFSEIMAKELLGPLPNPQYKQYASDIFDSGSHLLDLINDILDIAKIEAGKMTLAPRPLDPMVAIEQATRLTKRKAEEKGLSLVIDTEDLLEIEADHRAVKQILLNLLSNAVKFTNQGAVMVHARGNTQGLTLRVVDTGCGILPERLPRLARPFDHVEQELTGNQGAGFGLALTKSLVEMHGGKLSIQSEVGRGTIVTVTLPRTFGGQLEQEAAAS